MFKKVLQSISKSLHKQTTETPPAKPTAKATAPAAASTKAAPAAAPVKAEAPKSAEELLGIESRMNKDQIRDQLKLLYRRYNRAASSLDNKTRAEADTMLNAIVEIREKHFGAI